MCTAEKCNLFYDITMGQYGRLLKPDVWREHAAKDEQNLTRRMVDAALAKVQEDEDHLATLLSQVTLTPQPPSPPPKPPSMTKAKKLEHADVYGSIHDRIDEIKGILKGLPDPTALQDMELENVIMLVDGRNDKCISLKQRADIIQKQKRFKFLRGMADELDVELDNCIASFRLIRSRYDYVRKERRKVNSSVNTLNTSESQKLFRGPILMSAFPPPLQNITSRPF